MSKIDFTENEDLPPELAEARESAQRLMNAVESQVTAYRLSKLTEEPKCPECGAGVLRQKCMWDFGPSCPRHDVANAYGGDTAIYEHLEDISGNVAFVEIAANDIGVFYVKARFYENLSVKDWYVSCQIYKGNTHSNKRLLAFLQARFEEKQDENPVWEAHKAMNGVSSEKHMVGDKESLRLVDYACNFVRSFGLTQFKAKVVDRPTREQMKHVRE